MRAVHIPTRTLRVQDPGVGRAGRRERRAGHRRQARRGAARPRGAAVPGPPAHRGRAGDRQDRCWPRRIARSLGLLLPAHPVHAGPAADRRHGPLDLQPEDPGVRVPAGSHRQPDRARRRDQPGDAQDPVGAPRVHGRAAHDRGWHHLPDAHARSWSSPPRTPSSTRARSRCRRRSSTGSCSGSGWAIPRRSRRSSSSTSRSGAIRWTSCRSWPRSRSCWRCRPGVREIYVDSAISDYIVRLVNATRTPPGRVPRAPRHAARSRCTGPARRTRRISGRDFVIPDDIKMLAEPALAHRLIVRTAATIRDVAAGSIVRELLDVVPVDGRVAALRAAVDRCPSEACPWQLPASRTHHPGRASALMRRLQLELRGRSSRPGHASSRSRPASAALTFLFYLLLLVLGGCWLVTRCPCGASRRASRSTGATAQVGDTLTVSYTVRDRSRLPKLWLDVHNPSALLACASRAARSACAPASSAAGRCRSRSPAAGTTGSSPMVIRTGDPLGLFEAYATVGPGTTDRGHAAGRAAAAVPAAAPRMIEGAAARPERAAQTTPLVTGVRPYVPTDAFNRIHWRLERPPRRAPGQGVRGPAHRRPVDVPRPRPGGPRGHDDSATVETAVRVAASIGGRALDEGRALGLEAASSGARCCPPIADPASARSCCTSWRAPRRMPAHRCVSCCS